MMATFAHPKPWRCRLGLHDFRSIGGPTIAWLAMAAATGHATYPVQYQACCRVGCSRKRVGEEQWNG